MRCFKLLLMGCIVLGVAGLAYATPVHIPMRHGWNGPWLMHITDWGMGTVYDQTGTAISKIPGVPDEPIQLGKTYYTSDWDLPVLVPTAGGKPGETGWGLVQVDTIYPAEWISKTYNNIGNPDVLNPLYLSGDQGVEMVGMYANREDVAVTFNADGSQTFEYKGDTLEFFLQPAGRFDTGAAGSAGRIPGQDEYVTVGYDAAGNQYADAVKVWTLELEAGYFGTKDETEGISLFYVDAGPSGSSDEFLSFILDDGEGTDEINWANDAFYPWKFKDADGDGVNDFLWSDIRVHVTTTLTDQADWLVSSSDPVTGTLIPEPVTMAGLMLGIGSLLGYIRRRR